MDSILFSTPHNKVPENHKAGFFDGFDGRKLRYAYFRSSGQVAKGTIVLLHGRNECIEKYFETIRYLTAQGFWVATFDWRGQGGSERILVGKQRGYVKQFKHYEEDLKIFLEQIVLPDTRMPFFAFGHSMGGLVLLSAAPMIANRIDRIAVASPFVGLRMKGVKRLLLNTALKLSELLFMGSLPLLGRPDEKERFDSLTSDQNRYQRNRQIFEQYPEFRTGPPTFRWLSRMLNTIGRVTKQSHLETINVPTIILAGSHDGIVPFAAFEDISTKFRAGQMIPFDGARHEILQEVDIYREPALAAVTAFFTTVD